MNKISVYRLAFALATTATALYAGCALVLLAAGRERAILFFNSLLHGLDVGPIVRMQMPWPEMLVGIVSVFVIAWLTGALIAVLYNVSRRDQK